MYAYALSHPEAKVKVFAAGADAKTEEKTLAEVVDGFVKEINAQGSKLFKAYAATGTKVRSDGGEEERADIEVGKRVKALRAKAPGEYKDYTVAMKAVLAADEQLAERYNQQFAGDQAH